MPKAFYQLETFTGCRSVGYLIRRLYTLIMPRAEAQFADAELTFSQWVVLMSLRDGVANTCADIARHMNHDTGAVTRLVDQLKQRGLIDSARSRKDRRVVHLKLRPKGKEMAAALMPRMVNFWNYMLSDFSPREAAMLVDLLTRLNDRMKTEPVETPEATRKPAQKQKTSKRMS